MVPSWNHVLLVFVSAAAMYPAVLLVIRLNGLRSLSQLSGYDLVTTIATGAILGRTILLHDPPLLQGVVALAALYAFQRLASWWRLHGGTRFIDSRPLLLMEEGRVLERNLKAAGVSQSDLRAKLRAANVSDRSAVLAVVLETTGDISVLQAPDSGTQLDPWLLEGVRRQVRERP